MKEKLIMASFLGGTFADMGTTMAALGHGFREVGPFASIMQEQGNMNAAYITRVAVSAVIIGLYALSSEKSEFYSGVIYKGMRITNIIGWGLAAITAVEILAASS